MLNTTVMNQLRILVTHFGVSPNEQVESLQCDECGHWNTLAKWHWGFRIEPGVYRTDGLKCPDCGHFHSPYDGPIRFATIDSENIDAQTVHGGKALPTVRKRAFSIEDFGPFEGWTHGANWNGWACPYFDKQVADQIVERYNESSLVPGFTAWYDAETDEYCFEMRADGSPEGIDRYSSSTINVNGETLQVYAIGSGAWCWETEIIGEDKTAIDRLVIGQTAYLNMTYTKAHRDNSAEITVFCTGWEVSSCDGTRIALCVQPVRGNGEMWLAPMDFFGADSKVLKSLKEIIG